MKSLGSESISMFFLFVFQQYSKQLEETMENFALGETKILICTNIVESGLDIQNANTIIIQDVHQFGLAQLYQVAMSTLYLYFFAFFPHFSGLLHIVEGGDPYFFTCKSYVSQPTVGAVVRHMVLMVQVGLR